VGAQTTTKERTMTIDLRDLLTATWALLRFVARWASLFI
jgi:hypothetical protein